MSKKIQYRAVNVEQVSPESVAERFAEGSKVVVGVDVAKRHFVAALCDVEGTAQVRVRFEHPRQTATFLQLLERLHQGARPVEVAMEPTGTYGDVLRYQLGVRGIAVFRVSNKHVGDATELFDGSPSKHDGKDACVVGWLHAHGRSKPWQELEPARRSARALVSQRDLYDEPLRRLLAQLEPMLARHFPEFQTFFDLSQRKTPWVVLEAFGSPKLIGRSDVQTLQKLLKERTRRAPSTEVLTALLAAANNTSGTSMVPEEVELMRRMSTEVLHLMQRRREIDVRIEALAEEDPVMQALRPCLGPVTAAVIYAFLGDPRTYASAAALEKAAGLNLIESSSGTNPKAHDKVPRHLSKRGAGVVRKYLYLAAMRLVQKDPTAKAWYQARRSFKAEEKNKALVAVMRKLCRAIFHIAKGEALDVTKLFDTRRLSLAPTRTEEAA
jgi:transposase